MDEQRTWIRSRRRKHLRIAAVILCVCLLVTTYPDILAALSAFATEWKDNTVHVSGFVELPEAVRVQTVPLGTGEEELSLPDTLEAYAAAAENINPSEGAEQPGNPEGEDADQPGDSGEENENHPENPEEKDGNQSENTEGEGINPPEDGTGEQGDGSDDTGNPENGNDDATVESDGGDTQNLDGGNSGSNDDVEQPAEDENAATVELNDGNNGAETEPQNDSASADDRDGVLSVQSGVFVMPVYMAEPVATAETQTLERKEETIMIKGVTWQSEPAYDGNVEGIYIFTSVLPEGYALSEGVTLPQITVTVQENDEAAEDTEVQTLIARITVLPDVQEYMEKEPDIDNWKEDNDAYEEAYEEWMEGLSAYAEEARDIWEAYETLTQEQRVHIPEEALVKLTAWVELAEQFAGSKNVMAAATSGTLSTGLSWSFSNGTLTISGNGPMPDFESFKGPFYTDSDLKDNIKKIVIKNGVTRIGENAFEFCTNVTSVEIPDTVTSIGSGSFTCCNALTSVTIPKNVTSIEYGTFSSCYALTSVTIPENVTSIAGRAFHSCSGLTSVTIPEKVTSIGSTAFYGCSKLTNMKIPGSVKSIGSSAFRSCTNLASVTFERRTPPTLGDRCFDDCKDTLIIQVPCGTKSAYMTKLGWGDDKDSNISEVPHITEKVSAVSATCLAGGNKEYWRCTVCDGLFSDSAGTTATTLANMTIAKKAHSYTYSASGAVITETCVNGCDHSATATLSIKSGANLTYTGSAIKPVTVTYGTGWAGTGTKKPAESAITYTNNTNVGTATAKLTISSKTASLTFTIKSAAMSGVSANGYTGTYDNAAHGITVTAPTDATIKYRETASGSYTLTDSPTYTDVGTYTVYYQVTKDNYTTKTGSAKVKIDSCDISDAIVTLDSTALTYNGSGQTKTVIGVTVGDRTLIEGTDYTVSGNTETEAGTHTITIAGTGNYTGTVTKDFTITGKMLTETMVTLAFDSDVYTGEGIKPAVTVQDGSKTLTETTDYTVSYSNNTNAGTATVKVTGTGNYAGTVTKQFTITPKSLTDGMVTLADNSYVYTGTGINPAVTVQDDSKTLTVTADYTVSYTDNTNVGTATVMVTGTGNYTGTVTKTFDITPADISSAVVELGAELTYNGTEQTQTITSVTVNGRALVAGTDYTVSGNAGTNAGDYELTFTGKDNYTGTTTKSFTIARKPLTVSMVRLDARYHDYTGEEIKPAVTVKDGDSMLESGKDYSVDYANNTEIGTGATVTVTGKGNYAGTVEVKFVIRDGNVTPPDINKDDLDIGYKGGVIELPDDIKDEVEIYTDPDDPEGSMITPNPDGSLPVEPGDTIYIRYKEKDETTPASDGIKIEIPGRPKAPEPVEKEEITVTDTTITVPKPDDGKDYEYVLVEKGQEPDWNNPTAPGQQANDTGEFTDLDPNKEYDLYVREKATEDSFASEPAKTEIRTTVTIKEPVIEGENADKPDNTVTKPDAPDEDGNSVTYTGTCGEDYTPVIIVDGKEITPDITWDEDGKTGEWTYTVPVEDGKPAVEIKVEFKEREYTGLKIEPSELSIYADNAANESMEALTGYLKNHCVITKEYDNQSNENIPWKSDSYTVEGCFVQTGTEYRYTVEDNNKSGTVTLTVKPVTAQTENPEGIAKKTKAGGYTAQEVSGWLPEKVTVTYTGAGYATRTENIAVTWNISSIGANFGASKGSETIGGSIALPGWATGQASAAIVIEFSVVEDNPPEISADDLDYSGGIIKLPDDIKDQVEIYTDPDDPEGSRITLNPDGSLPDVEPGTTIYISYPDSEKATEIKIPDRPKAPEPVEKEEVIVTDTTITVPKPDDGKDYEYVLVEKGKEPDWSNPNTTGKFTDLDPNKEYDLYVREKATEDNFASEPAKTEIKTPVTIKEPVIEGENANKPGNNVSKPEAPDAEGDSVTYTGTCGEDYTPVIKVDGKDIIPDITWDEDGKTGEWTYTVPVEDGKPAVEIKVEFNKRVYKGLKATPGTLTIYADNAANNSVDALTGYLKEKCVIMAEYDNGVNEVIPAEAVEYTTVTKDFDLKGKEYHYTIKSAGDTIDMTLTVSPVTAATEAPDALTKSRKAGGYTAQEVSGWLPPAVTVTYSGDGYAAKSQDVAVTWNTDAIGADFGAAKGSKTISGTAALPEWATGEKNVSIEIGFVDNNVLTDAQMNLFISGWTYGAQTVPAPNGSITVSDTDQTYNYLYSADNGTSWVAADKLPKSGSGNIIPGTYIVKMTYTGKNYTGTKTASFTVDGKALTVGKGTLEVENRKYDGTTNATLKKDGKPELSGVIEKDDAMLGGILSAVFTDKGPKKDIPVSVTGFELTGSDAKCYRLENATITLNATISKAGGNSSSGGSGGNGGSSGNSGSGDNSESGGNSGNSDKSGNNGNGGNAVNTGSDGNSGNGGNTGTDKGSSGIGSTSGTDKGSNGTSKGGSGTGSGKGGTETGKGTSGTDKDSNNNGSVNGGSGKRTEGTTGQSGQGTKAGSTDAAGQNGAAQSGSGQHMEGDTVQTIQASADDGRIVISGETEAPAATGNLTQDSSAATWLMVGDGAVIVTVVCEDGKYTAGVNDAVSVANAVLTSEQIQLVDNGGTMEVRVDIRDISDSVPLQDMETVGKGYEAYGKYLPELLLGAYVDISVYVKNEDGVWDAVTETREPVEIVIGIPEELQSEGREYYIIRAHNGEYNLLEDMDDELVTITVRTSMFSSYAIAYRQTSGAVGNNKCGLCHICPTFFGVCCFIWMAVMAAGGFVAVIVILMRKKETEKA